MIRHRFPWYACPHWLCRLRRARGRRQGVPFPRGTPLFDEQASRDADREWIMSQARRPKVHNANEEPKP